MEPATKKPDTRNKKWILRALIETGFIIFLFYANLLMGEFDKTGNGQAKSFFLGIKRCFYTS